MAPNVLRSQLPVFLPGLGHVNCYFLQDDRGVTIVDPGLPGPQSWRALVDRLKQAGLQAPGRAHGGGHALAPGPLRRRRALPGQLRRGHPHAPQLHDLVRPRVRRRRPRRGRRARSPTPCPSAGRCRGARTRRSAPARSPPDRFTAHAHGGPSLHADAGAHPAACTTARSCTLGGREWVSLHTPGPHRRPPLPVSTPSRAWCSRATTCCRRSRRTSPACRRRRRDPLTEFFRSLEKVAELEGVQQVLPAHGHPFVDLAGRAKEIREHHEERLDTLRTAAERARLRHGRGATCSGCSSRGRGARWPRARRTRTSSTSAYTGEAESASEDGLLRYHLVERP